MSQGDNEYYCLLWDYLARGQGQGGQRGQGQYLKFQFR